MKMKNDPHPPDFEAEAFDCPHCYAYAHMQWEHPSVSPYYPPIHVAVAACAKCREVSIWRMGSVGDPPKRSGRMIFPERLGGPPPHPDMPHDCRQDYEEARAIFTYSPRASAALLRLCVQKLCIHLGEPGKNINADIKTLVDKGLPVLVQQALDAIRVTGNNAVHPGVMSEEDTQGLTSNLFDLVNYIVENQITHPKTIKSLYGLIPESARDAIEKRDGQIKHQPPTPTRCDT